MKQITEDFVSFEIAKLLKEKGFDEPCIAYWDEDENKLRVVYLIHKFRNITNPSFFGPSAPTHKMALKWLREVHKCYTHICPFYPDMKYNEPPKWLAAVDYNSEGYPTLPKHFDSYEEACESALLYVLKNLI